AGATDYYRSTVPTGQFATVTAAPVEGTLAGLELYDAAGTLLARGVAGPGGDLTIRDLLSSGGEDVVRVLGTPGNRYGLVVVRGSTLDLEPNDTPATAQPLTGATQVLGSLYPVVDFTDVSGAASLEGFTATGLWHVTNQAGANLPGHSTPHIAYFG